MKTQKALKLMLIAAIGILVTGSLLLLSYLQYGNWWQNMINSIRYSNYQISITEPTGTVYPYNDIVKLYLSEEEPNIMRYYMAGSVQSGDASLEPVEIAWNDGNDSRVTRYEVQYGTKADYSDGITVVKDTDLQTRKIGVYNLYKSTTYYVRVTAYAGENQMGQAESTFQTTDLGPRVLKIDGIYNVRDVGGYATESGQTTRQGMIYRGSELDGNNEMELSAEGEVFMNKVLGIRTDLDFRGDTNPSPISSAGKLPIAIGGYTDAFTQQEQYRQIFAAFANEENYPIYMHCVGGADRTGTVCYLLNALLGVSEADLIRDYEFTSYSIFGERTKDSTIYAFPQFVERLQTYPGDTLQEKSESFLRSIGVTDEEITSIRNIMLG